MANPHPINPHPWLESELQIIRDNFPNMGKKATATLLVNRTPGAVQRQASLLGIRSLVRGKLLSQTKLIANVSSNIHYFKTWSPNMAWMLGYVWADGAIGCDKERGQNSQRFSSTSATTSSVKACGTSSQRKTKSYATDTPWMGQQFSQIFWEDPSAVSKIAPETWDCVAWAHEEGGDGLKKKIKSYPISSPQPHPQSSQSLSRTGLPKQSQCGHGYLALERSRQQLSTSL